MSRLLIILFVALSFYSQGQSYKPELQTSEVHDLIVNYQADLGSLTRFYFVPNTAERRDRMKAFFNDYLKRLSELQFDQMSNGGRVDYLLVKRSLESNLYELEKERKECEQLPKLVAQGEQIYNLEKQRRR